MDAAGACCVDHPPAFVEAERHGFLDQYVLPLVRGEKDMLQMQLMRCGDVDRLHALVGAEVSDLFIRRSREFPRETFARFGSNVCTCDKLEARMPEERWQHQHEGASEARNAYAQPGRNGLATVIVWHWLQSADDETTRHQS
jgi:hypothetical protein